jgi:hypothetical protein
MSAALETPATSSTPLSLASENTVSHTAIEAIQPSVVNVTFAFDTQREEWVVSPPIATIDLTFDTVDEITWNLIPPTVPNFNPATLFFLTPPISFPQTQIQAPMVVISNPQTTPRQCVAVWANVDETKTGTYSYTLNIEIAGQTLTHDPTVENESPTGGG